MVFAKLGHDVEAVTVGQLEVEQHQRGMLGLHDGDRFGSGTGAQHIVPRPLEIAAEGRGEVRLVVDDENLGHQGGGACTMTT